MKRISSQPLLCVALFLAGCLCFLVAWNPEWWTGESYSSGPAGGGGRIPGLEPKPPVKAEEPVKTEDGESSRNGPKPEDGSPGKEAASDAGTP